MIRFNQPMSPPPPGPREPIIRLRASDEFGVLVLSVKWTPFVVHWDVKEKRSFPCELTEETPCKLCVAELPKRWRSYVHVLRRKGQQNDEGFLEIMPGLADKILLELGQTSDLRGQRWRLFRGAGDKARVGIEVLAHHTAISQVPLKEERSPVPDLMRLWGFTKRKDYDQGVA